MIARRLVFAAAFVLVGCLLAAWVQTAGLRVQVTDIRLQTAEGQQLSALLYVPASVSEARPGPAVLAVHGYINSRETQSGFAIELARRGFVVLALDQTGHGYSDPPAFSAGFGGPAGLAYLRGLAFVDPQRIGLEGHSMGGWAVQMAAAAEPDGYAAMVLAGSSTGTFGAPEGTATHPRNLLLVFSRFDEFSELMWGSPTAAGITETDKLKTLFGTTEAVVVGRAYGNRYLGTARQLAMPAVTHPGDHLSVETIQQTVDWFETMLEHQSGVQQQTWYWKELATLMALVGLVMLVFPLLDLGLNLFGRALRGQPVKPSIQPLGSRRVAMLLTIVMPVLSFFPLQNLADTWLPANPFLPQQVTNGVLLWAWGNGLLTLVLFCVWYRRQANLNLRKCGLVLQAGQTFAVFKVALLVFAVLNLVVLLANDWLLVDFRFWVVGLKAMSAMQAGLFLIYLLPFTAFFLVQSASLHNQVQCYPNHPGPAMWCNGLVLSSGFVGLLLLQYTPLLLGGTLFFASQPLLSIVAFQFVPVLLLAGLMSTYCYHKTGSIYLGALLNGLLVTWYLVAGTATQAVPFFWTPAG